MAPEDGGRGDRKDNLNLSDVVRLKDPNIEALVVRLDVIFSDVILYKQLLRCRGADAQKLLDFFQWLLDASELATDRDFRRSLIIATQRISKNSNLYPTCYELEDVIQDGQDPVSAGGFADIYKGVFQGRAVCMKTIRMYQATKIEQYLKVFWKEAILWGQLSHPNVLPIYGLYRVRGKICLVSPWMEEGNVSEYLERKLDVNRLQLAVDVAQGLSYLHNNAIVHGDLKSPNILINDAGRACLADFGLSSISDSKILKWTSHSSAASKGGSVRWQAPELFDVENDIVVNNSMASDIYAWALVCYEIFTGDVPFANILRDATIMHQVKSGARPLPPPVSSLSRREWGLTGKIWMVIERCWAQDPLERPNIDQVIERLMPDMVQDERLRTTENVLSPSNFRRVSKPFNAFTVSALDALLSATVVSTSSTIPSSSDAPLAQPVVSRNNMAQSVPRTGTQSRPRVRFQVPLPATTVSERPATLAQTARTPAYTLPITTTSPPPPNVRLIHYPQLMNPHQKTQGYYPSIASTFAPRDAPPSPGIRFLNPLVEDEDSLASSFHRAKGELRKVLLPRECLPRFLKISKANTDANLEMCGLLLGKEEQGVRFRITTLLIPKQHATSDTCTIDKEELVSLFTEERRKITLGWIHTHPSQSCFMTSGDLHTHAKFQRVLPESFAVVCAPKSTPNFGIFRLTDPPGLRTVLGCIAREMYHPHPDLPIYTDADKGHVQMEDLQLEIVDLR